MSNWFISGISRGFGKVLAEELLAQGHSVFGTIRSGSSDIQHPNLIVATLDVTHAQRCAQAIKHMLIHFTTVDVIVNNAGFGIVGAVEEVSRAEFDQVLNTNLFGTINILKAVLPQLRRQHTGHIINFSSVGGFIGIPGFGAYNASKFAVEGLSEALAAEVAPLGIKVTIVEPGPFRTDFLAKDSLLRAAKSIADYTDTSGKTRTYAEERHGSQAGDPKLAVKVIIQAASSKNPPLHLPLGKDSIERIRRKLKLVEDEISEWQSISSATDFPPP
jgi:NAD(P)-dependent dehydrogenase (short-subunit alcohol dehydrogenase family)